MMIKVENSTPCIHYEGLSCMISMALLLQTARHNVSSDSVEKLCPVRHFILTFPVYSAQIEQNEQQSSTPPPPHP